MAARIGGVSIPVDVEYNGQALRTVALDKALELAHNNATQGHGLITSSDKLLEDAQRIERYLRDGLAVTDDDIRRFKAAWHEANDQGDEGNRVLRGLEAVFRGRA
ncbi:hypothetical protein SEA_MILANI_56 [Microbacterium phage Milani]|nr:hypothetical protein SEA_MILANI_56 [Microbacterium phage Milani]